MWICALTHSLDNLEALTAAVQEEVFQSAPTLCAVTQSQVRLVRVLHPPRAPLISSLLLSYCQCVMLSNNFTRRLDHPVATLRTVVHLCFLPSALPLLLHCASWW